MSLSSIFLTALIGFGVWYWIKSRDLKEFAYRRVARECKRLDLQLLDQTVALKSVRLARNHRGAMSLRRVYGFDFSSTGEDRYEGEIIFLGSLVEEVKFAPHRIH
ncbi:MAG: DUF3301 domain-containing protein [Oleiphilaceae bacterium]|nr:DUF3301 domain-containing protein [Oleiphilaceae bacterium]